MNYICQKFLSQTHRQTHRQTDRHFPEVVKSCSGHPKTCKSFINRNLIICTKPILSSTYIEESKNCIMSLTFTLYCIPYIYTLYCMLCSCILYILSLTFHFYSYILPVSSCCQLLSTKTLITSYLK